jgi:hypothetical protein
LVNDFPNPGKRFPNSVYDFPAFLLRKKLPGGTAIFAYLGGSVRENPVLCSYRPAKPAGAALGTFGVVVVTVESTRARKIELPGMTPGTTYSLEARAIGGSTGYSDWSLPTSIMAT